MNADPAPSRWRWPLYGLGTAMAAYGVWGQLFGADTNPRRWAELLVLAAFGHDLVFAPLVFLVALLAGRVLPARIRPVLQGAALTGVVLLLVAVPALGRYGARADNPSILPRDYRGGLVVALLVVAAAAGLLLLVQACRRSAQRR